MQQHRGFCAGTYSRSGLAIRSRAARAASHSLKVEVRGQCLCRDKIVLLLAIIL